MDDQVATANQAERPSQGPAGPAQVPSHLVLVAPSETPSDTSSDTSGQAWAPSAAAPTSGQDPRARAAAAAAAAVAADLHPGPAASTTPVAGDGAPVSRWAYAGMASTSATSTTSAAPARAQTRTTAPTTRTSAPSQQAERASFLRSTDVEAPARHGWRGALSRLGLKVAPSADERGERADIAAVAAHWAGHRTVAVVNGKGGSSKSPTTALLSAVFARHGGTGVLAWENNQTRGTLGWRTEQGPHDATLLDLMPAVPDLLGRRAGIGDFAAYTHHQIVDRYDVLRAQPMALAEEQRISPDDVTAIHEVATKFNRLIVIDSGNDESDPMWRRMIDHTDQLVVATTTRDDHAEVAALLLETLARRDAHRARLARGAVVVVSQADRSATRADLDRVAGGFADLARDVITVRFDPAMVDGVLRWDTLHPTTQRDWLRAGAAVARGL